MMHQLGLWDSLDLYQASTAIIRRYKEDPSKQNTDLSEIKQQRDHCFNLLIDRIPKTHFRNIEELLKQSHIS